jgi:predicted TIM-barrel fold metal-dependent hydrolase
MTDDVPFGKISGDAHVDEPRNLWRDNLPRALQDDAMSGITSGDDGGWQLTLGQNDVAKAQPEEERLLTSDPAHRRAIMREEGIIGECIFPTIGLYVWMLQEGAAGEASCRVYNEWMADGLARLPEFKCAGLVPTWSIERALAGVARIAESNLSSFMLPAVATPDWNHPSWEPLWSAIEDTGMPVVMHQGTGHSMFYYRGPGAGVSNLMATQSIAPRTAALLANAGVLERHPKLHVVFVEFNVGWLAWTMDTMDFYTAAFKRYGTTGQGKPWINPELPLQPSHYLRRQIHATFQDDSVAIHNVALTGSEGLIWGSDYPHQEGTYPHSPEVVARLAAGLGPSDTANIFRDNAARLFNFDLAKLDELDALARAV